MKKANNMTELFEKLNDLKTVFQYGEKLIPIIQSIIEFMRETVPLLENINSSIEESTSKIPKATDQIMNVTNANEIATTEILDIVDEMSNNLFKANDYASELWEQEKKKAEVWNRIKEKLAGEPDLIKEYESLKLSFDRNTFQGVVQSLQDQVYRITLSLQVQDITSQQLAAVNHLIESVHNKLNLLITDFHEANIKEPKNDITMEPVTGVAFDPNARYHDKKEKQEEIDELVSSQFEKASQAEIDKLFS